MKSNVRRFTFRINLTDGRYLDILRECDRPIPPKWDWVLNDQREIMTAPYNNGWTRVKTIDGHHEQVQTSHIVSISLIDVKEGVDINSVKERFGIGINKED